MDDWGNLMEDVTSDDRKYKAYHNDETVYLTIKDKKEIVIGDFYGDPKCACFDKDSKWIAMGGCGLIIYFLEEPFEAYRYHYVDKTDQWAEFWRYGDDIQWVETIEQIGSRKIQLNSKFQDNWIVEF